MSTSFKIIKLKVEYTLKYLNLNDNITALTLVYKTYFILIDNLKNLVGI